MTLTMHDFLAAVAAHGHATPEVLLAAGHHPSVVLAKATKAAVKGYTDYGVVPDRPWLTDRGRAFLGSDTPPAPTTDDIIAAAGWSGHRPKALTDALTVGALRPPNPRPGSGQPVTWTRHDLTDAHLIGAWRRLVGDDRSAGPAHTIEIVTTVLDLWRELGRPPGWIGTYHTGTRRRPRWWPGPRRVAADIASGHPVAAIPTP